MSQQCGYTRLRLQVETALNLYKSNTEPEKKILISLHKVLSEIQLLKQAANGLKADGEGEADGRRSCFCCDEDCVKLIVGDMVWMLEAVSEFVQHSAVNVLVTLSEIMAESQKDWETYVSTLSGCLEMAVSNSLPFSSTSSNSGGQAQELVSNLLTDTVKTDFENLNWSVVSSIIQIYRKIFKNLKQDYEENLVLVCLKYTCTWLSCVPWSSICDFHAYQSSCDSHPDPEIYSKVVLGSKIKMLLLGNLLQLFCSLVDQDFCLESATGLEVKQKVLGKIQNLLPLLSSWCLCNQRNVSSLPMNHYFRHKLLVLMLRLVAEISVDPSIFHSCLELLHTYFEDTLNQKLTFIEVTDSACLQDSPFSHSTHEEGACKTSQQHLQRLAILVLFKCTTAIIALEAKTNLSRICANSLTSAGLEDRCCDSRKGLTELYIWVKGQHPIYCYEDSDKYTKKCINFASSLLNLFIYEDDMLFQVLLQLFKLTSSGSQMFHEDNFSVMELKSDIVFHISNNFNPMMLFYIFLSKLHYDHQILLDYLISKDVGLSCAEYLLRCLRRAGESWKSFIQYSFEDVPIQSNKKRKTVPEKVTKNDRGETCMLWDRGDAYEKAKQCLLSLRVSVENLHRRKLFPYNAEILLKRLRRFEELCLIEENQKHS